MGSIEPIIKTQASDGEKIETKINLDANGVPSPYVQYFSEEFQQMKK